MKRTARLLVLSFCIAWASRAGAYDPQSHRQMSEAAAVRSGVSADMGVLKSLGLDETYLSVKRLPNSQGVNRSVLELFGDSAQFEDNNTRSLNHFFNPMTGQGVPGFQPSLVWAIDGTGDTSTTKFSYRSAREYLFKALTDPVESFRIKQFGLMFETLGHVVHHIRDMAQPQHVRGDLHCVVLFPCKYPGAAFDLYYPSAYEAYTKEIRINDAFLELTRFCGHVSY